MYLNLTYPVHITWNRLQFICSSTQIIIIILSLVNGFVEFAHPVGRAIAYITLDTIFLVVFVSLYSYLFRKTFFNRRLNVSGGPNITIKHHQSTNWLKAFNQSRTIQRTTQEQENQTGGHGDLPTSITTNKPTNQRLSHRIFHSKFIIIWMIGLSYIAFTILPDLFILNCTLEIKSNSTISSINKSWQDLKDNIDSNKSYQFNAEISHNYTDDETNFAEDIKDTNIRFCQEAQYWTHLLWRLSFTFDSITMFIFERSFKRYIWRRFKQVGNS